MFNAVIEAHFRCSRKFLPDWPILLHWDRRIMSFDDDSSHFKARRAVEKGRDSLADSRFDHRDEIAPFLKSHFHDVNEVDWTLIRVPLSFSWIFLTLSIDWHWFVFLFTTLTETLAFCCCALLKPSEIRVHASLFLIFRMSLFYCSSTSSCRDSFVGFSDSVWFKPADNVSYDLNHVNWSDTWHEEYFSRALCVSLIITTSFL